jgi:hypothetical protein
LLGISPDAFETIVGGLLVALIGWWVAKSYTESPRKAIAAGVIFAAIERWLGQNPTPWPWLIEERTLPVSPSRYRAFSVSSRSLELGLITA